MSLLRYKYYDTPEGQDIYKKVFVTSKYAAISGLSYSIFDVLLYSYPKGFLSTASRVMYCTGPVVGMAIAFTATANGVQNYRGKNDYLNYFLGGVAAGAVYGAWQKTTLGGFVAALGLGAAAMIKKSALENNVPLIPEIRQMKNTAWSHKHDYTLVADIEELKEWTRG